jgi:phosphatidylinositol-3-phosphatase
MRRSRAAVLCTLLIILVGVVAGSTTGASADSPHVGNPKITHVAVINLENESFADTFGDGSPYTSLRALAAQGKLLTNYYGIGHFSTPNYIAEISGQAPNSQTQLDCAFYNDFVSSGTDGNGQAIGNGCVFPSTIKTVADQLTSAGLTWKSYQEDMGTNPATGRLTCDHPSIGSLDPSVTVGTGYSTRHNPFMYFHSIIDSPACDTNVVGLPQLQTDLASESTTPNYVFVTPNQCNDGHTTPCPGRLSGPDAVNAWLDTWISRIMSSPAFRTHGLVVVTFDEAAPIGPSGDATSCCNEIAGPNPLLVGDLGQILHFPPLNGVIATGQPGMVGPGGGRVGAVLLGQAIQPGTSAVPYNHYSLLCSVENIFGLPHLGMAGRPDLACFGDDVYGRGNGQS